MNTKFTDRVNWLRAMFESAAPNIGAVLLLLCVPALLETHQLSSLLLVERGDTWWHLQTGLSILENHSVPQTGVFLQFPVMSGNVPNWLYDVLVALAFKGMGLLTFPMLLMLFRWALGTVTFLLAGGLRGTFWLAVGLSVIAQYTLSGNPVDPGYCSIIFLALELFLLNESSSRASARPLLWLPGIFLAWANVDVQFVYGIGVLALFLTVSLFRDASRQSVSKGQRQKSSQRKKPFKERTAAISPGTAGILAAACGLATLLNPYSYHLYGAFFGSFSSAENLYLRDSLSATYHRPQDYIILLLTTIAFLVLGLRRSYDPFRIVLLAGCGMISFHAQHESWLVLLAAIAVIAAPGNATRETEDPERKSPFRLQMLAAGALSFAILLLGMAFLLRMRNQESLLARAGQTYPVTRPNQA